MKPKNGNRKQRPAVNRLPKGANLNDAWAQVVVPNFINLALSGNNPWISGEDITPLLQDIWDRTYGDRLPFTIERGTTPFELVSEILRIITANYYFYRLIRNFVNTGIALHRRQSQLYTTIFVRLM